jgi:hypothetical protein
MDFHDGCPIVFRFPSGMSNVISLPVHWYPSSIQVASCILSDWPTKKPLVSCHLYTHHLSRCHQKYRKTYNLPEPLAHQLRLVNWMDVRTRLSSFSHRHTRAGKEVRSVWSCFDPPATHWMPRRYFLLTPGYHLLSTSHHFNLADVCSSV